MNEIKKEREVDREEAVNKIGDIRGTVCVNGKMNFRNAEAM